MEQAKKLAYNIDFTTGWQIDMFDADIARWRNNRLATVPAVAHALDADERFNSPPFSILEVLWPFVYYVFYDDLPAASSSTSDRVEYAIDWMKLRDTTSGTLRQLFRATLESEGITFRFQDSGKRGFVHYLAWSGNELYLDFFLGLRSSSIEDVCPASRRVWQNPFTLCGFPEGTNTSFAFCSFWTQTSLPRTPS